MKNVISRKVLGMSFLRGFSAHVCAASDLTGQVKAININKSWGGIFIQLEGAPLFEPGSACQQSWAFVAINDDYAKAILATATAAKLAGELLRIGTSGCVSTPIGQAAKIEWVDHGIRQ